MRYSSCAKSTLWHSGPSGARYRSTSSHLPAHNRNSTGKTQNSTAHIQRWKERALHCWVIYHSQVTIRILKVMWFLGLCLIGCRSAQLTHRPSMIRAWICSISEHISSSPTPVSKTSIQSELKCCCSRKYLNIARVSTCCGTSNSILCDCLTVNHWNKLFFSENQWLFSEHFKTQKLIESNKLIAVGISKTKKEVSLESHGVEDFKNKKRCPVKSSTASSLSAGCWRVIGENDCKKRGNIFWRSLHQNKLITVGVRHCGQNRATHYTS